MLELKKSILKFHKGKESLDNILVSQKGHKNKRGLGYACNTPSSLSNQNIFVKAKMNTTHASTSGTKTLPTHAKNLTCLELSLQI